MPPKETPIAKPRLASGNIDDFQRKTADLGTIIDVGGYDVRGQQMAKHIDGYM